METKLCRICGKLSENYVHIFKTEGLKNKIETCLPIIVSQYCLLPDTICSECLENVNNFYSFIKNCLQNIIVLEAQYDITESCLKTKRKHEKSCLTDFAIIKFDKNIQTDEDFSDLLLEKEKSSGATLPYLQVEKLSAALLNAENILNGKETELINANLSYRRQENLSNPKLTLVTYDLDSEQDSENDEGSNANIGKVIVTQKIVSNRNSTESFRPNQFIRTDPYQTSANVSQIQNEHSSTFKNVNKRYFDDEENNLINEIAQRKSLKRKSNTILPQTTKIFKLDTSNKRKSRQPKKLENVGNAKSADSSLTFNTLEQMYTEMEKGTTTSNVDKFGDFTKEEKINFHQIDKETNNCLPQICLLCDLQFSGPTSLAAHVYDTHGIDMAEVISSEPVMEKKKRLPNLVKITDLKKNDSPDGSSRQDNELLYSDEPPVLQPTFVCPICPDVWRSRSDLYVHLRVKHAKKAAFICGLCLNISISYNNLMNHVETCKHQHNIHAKYFCKICCYSDDNPKVVEHHVPVHDFVVAFCKKQAKIFDPCDYIENNSNCDSSAKTLVCTECNQGGFASFKEFSTHRRSQHQIFHCDLCNKFYGRNSHLWKHVNRLHKGHPSITCQLCSKTSASKYHLAQHFNKIHSIKPFKQKQVEANEDSQENFMSQKFQGFDFQSVKQSFMRQELLEQERKYAQENSDDAHCDANSDVDSNNDCYNRIEDLSASSRIVNNRDTKNCTPEMKLSTNDKSFCQELKSFGQDQKPRTKIIKSYIKEESHPMDVSNSIMDDVDDDYNGKQNLPHMLTDAKIKRESDIVAPPKEIDSSSNLYTNIITNYTPPQNEGEYKCPKCFKGFHKKNLLKKHKKNCRPRLQKDLLTRCKTCSRIFKDRQSLTKHLINYHSEYACEICNQKVQSKCEIVSHIRFSHPSSHLVCHCGNILRSTVDLNEHKKDHRNSFVCQFCADMLPTKIKLKMHILSLHRKILSLSCGICLKLFETQHILRDHVRLVHKDHLSPLTSCTVCGKNYGSKWKTYDHLNKSHGRIFKACKACLEVFDTEEELQKHYDTLHMNATQNKLNCSSQSSVNSPNVQHASSLKRDSYDSDLEQMNDENDKNSSSEYSNDIDSYGNYQSHSKSAVQNNSDVDESKPPLDFSSYSDYQNNDLKISLLEKRLLGKKSATESDFSTLSILSTVCNDKNKKQSLFSNKLKTSEGLNFKNKMSDSKQAKSSTKTTDSPSLLNYRREYEDCESGISSNPLQNSSKRTVYVNSNDPSLCEICLKTWPAKKHLWQHYIRCHKTVAATVCGICLKTNDNYESLQLHLQENHPTLLFGQGFGSNFICRICGRYHNASSKLKLHMAIHENFDWTILEGTALQKTDANDAARINKQMNREPQKQFMNNGFNEENVGEYYEEKQPVQGPPQLFSENILEGGDDINYESLIEQVECTSGSENESDVDDVDAVYADSKQYEALNSSSDDESDNDSVTSDANSLENQMFQNMLQEKQGFDANKARNVGQPKIKGQKMVQYYTPNVKIEPNEIEIKEENTTSDSEDTTDSNQSLSDVEIDNIAEEQVKSENGSWDEENSQLSQVSLSSDTRNINATIEVDMPQSNSNSNASDCVVVQNSSIFIRKPDELDSAIRSISYEQIENIDEQVVDDICEIQSHPLNQHEIQSAVDSIL